MKDLKEAQQEINKLIIKYYDLAKEAEEFNNTVQIEISLSTANKGGILYQRNDELGIRLIIEALKRISSIELERTENEILKILWGLK